ncbi:hypothetical protein M0802_002771 [Mischocyttarus mexicanus]|nr:hypothetical protein M0802_002771 [Mischocyttarus mexicanus]
MTSEDMVVGLGKSTSSALEVTRRNSRELEEFKEAGDSNKFHPISSLFPYSIVDNDNNNDQQLHNDDDDDDDDGKRQRNS